MRRTVLEGKWPARNFSLLHRKKLRERRRGRASKQQGEKLAKMGCQFCEEYEGKDSGSEAVLYLGICKGKGKATNDMFLL